MEGRLIDFFLILVFKKHVLKIILKNIYMCSSFKTFERILFLVISTIIILRNSIPQQILFHVHGGGDKKANKQKQKQTKIIKNKQKPKSVPAKPSNHLKKYIYILHFFRAVLVHSKSISFWNHLSYHKNIKKMFNLDHQQQ